MNLTYLLNFFQTSLAMQIYLKCFYIGCVRVNVVWINVCCSRQKTKVTPRLNPLEECVNGSKVNT